MTTIKISADQVWQRMRVACIRPICAPAPAVDPYLRRMVGVGVGEGGGIWGRFESPAVLARLFRYLECVLLFG